jgi:cystathionine beta-lyase
VAIDDVPLAELRLRTSAKWRYYRPDALPAWVAEMDFMLAPPIAQALHAAIDRSDTGYRWADEIPEALVQFCQDEWHWSVDADHVIVVADVMSGIAQALVHLTEPRSHVVINPPVYPPFFSTVENVTQRIVRSVPLMRSDFEYRLDLEALEEAFAEPQVQAYVLCSPHNPTGTVHSTEDLRTVAQLAAQHDVLVIADEIHAPMTLPGAHHYPFLLAAHDTADLRAVSCVSASKTWNIPGLKCAQVVGTDSVVEQLREAIPLEVTFGVGHFGVLGTLAAYREGAAWRQEMLEVLDRRRRQLREGLARFQDVDMTWPHASYLAWVHMPTLGEDPAAVLMEEALLVVTSGLPFGAPGIGHARINYATNEAILGEIIERVGAVVDAKAS